MGRLGRIHWAIYCLIVFIASRLILFYEFSLAKSIFLRHKADFFSVMCKWDCKWYLTIIQDGYDVTARTYPKVWEGLANWAFFPLYPYLVRLIADFVNSDYIITGIVLNQLFVLIAMLLFYQFLKLKFDELNSRFGVVLLAFTPFSIYFSSLYTEALFLMLSLATFYLMRQKMTFASSITAGLLSATRPVGIMIIVPYILFFVPKHKFSWKLFGCLIIATSGLLIYMIYLYYLTGDFLAFAHIQKAWGRIGFDEHKFTHQLINMVKDYHNFGIFILSCILSVILLINKLYPESLFNLLCILPGFMTGTILSEGRFSGTLFTFYLGLVILAKKSNSLKITLFIVFFIFYISYFMYWLSHAPFLI